MPLPALAALADAIAAHVDEVNSAAPFVQGAADEALALVGVHVGSRADVVPDSIGLRACVEVGADLFYRRTARNGIVGLNSMEVTPVRIQRDPMTAAYPLLAPFLGPGIA